MVTQSAFSLPSVMETELGAVNTVGQFEGDASKALPHLKGVSGAMNGEEGRGKGIVTVQSSSEIDKDKMLGEVASKLYMDGFRSLKEGEPVEFTFKKSSKGLESIWVTGPGGTSCIGSERRPKGKNVQKRRPKGDRCYNCGGLDHHAKECKLAPQPKKCHYCQSIGHMVANCTIKAAQQQQSTSSQGWQESKPATGPLTSSPSPTTPQEVGGEHSTALLLEETGEHLEKLLPESYDSGLQEFAEEPSKQDSSLQKRKTT
ncbi:protein lin-28 homolog A-like [Carcharodon carcharias]|uniref:protein lin-28 homolog A-like n=1 Tax=Carcharodon carcharias TaxID=13397 RepID=UPI001B7EB63E|nr:protein lin-28 homolog A-like [Carcharodon carcharias]